MLNVAMPPTADTVVVPPTPAGVELIVIEAFEPVTRFPFVSSTLTTTAANTEPAVPFVGCVVNTSFEPVPALIVNELLVALLKPLLAAVSV